MSDIVLVKDGQNSKTYHVDEDGTPACGVRDGANPEDWREWGIEKAKVWRAPCQRPGCYGESVEERAEDTTEARPV